MSVIPTLRRQRQKNLEFKGSLGYIHIETQSHSPKKLKTLKGNNHKI
jgi:hypothetical protein